LIELTYFLTIVVGGVVVKILYDWFRNRDNPQILRRLEKRFEDHTHHVVYRDTCEATHRAVEQRLDAMERRLERIEGKIDKIHERL